MKKLIKEILCSNFIVALFMLVFRKRIPNLRYFQKFNFPRNKENRRVIGTLIWGFYEAAEIRLINKFMRNDLPVIELGSSSGIVSSFASSKIRNQKMICVEGNPELISFIEKNVTSVNDQIDLKVLNRVIAYGEDEIDFQVSKNTTSSSLVGNSSQEHVDNQIVRVKTTTLKNITEENDIREYVLISDIEGAEYMVLNNDKEALSKCRQIIIELHDASNGKDYSINSLQSLIIDLGFKQSQKDGNAFVFVKN